MNGIPVLSLLIMVPILGSITVALLPRRDDLIRQVAALFAAVPLALSVAMYFQMTGGGTGFQFVERYPWFTQVGISYHLGIDGLSYPMVFLSALLVFLSVIASYSIKERVKGYYSLLLLLEAGIIGVFVALDYILFYVFWETVLVPMFFLIGIWGGPRREYASVKFFVYTLLGSVFMLLAILALYHYAGGNTFDIVAIAGLLNESPLARPLEYLIFGGLFLGFAVKVPIFPFHTWLPDAHVEAPTAVSVILAGVLLKMGAYGFLRIAMPTLPQAFEHFIPVLGALAVINIVYGAAVAMAQQDLKKMVAYSSVSHMGFVMLGVATATTLGLSGAVFTMFSHGVITGMMFLLVGYIYERTHTRQIEELGGLSGQMPVLSGILTFDSMAALGLPALSGFIGEFLVLLGALQAESIRMYMIVAALAGIVMTAGYMLLMVQRVTLGELPAAHASLPDASLRELLTLVPLMAFVVSIGLFPSVLLRIIEPAVMTIASLLR